MGLEKCVFCRICGQKYFPVSLPFHQRVCIKVFQLTHSDCPICKRAVFNCDWSDHVDLCRKIGGKPTAAGMSVIATLQSVEAGLARMGGLGAGDSQGRHPCQVCGRKFTLDRISTHENVCRRRLAAGAIQTKADQDAAQSMAPPIKKGANVMTLSSMNRPKSKQTKAMPSLRNAAKPEPKPKKQPQTFGGAGVMIGSYSQPEEQKTPVRPQTSFTGLKVVAQPSAKQAEPRYRCLKCYSLNKVDQVQCQKCHFKRDLTTEEKQSIAKEEIELQKAVAEWGDLSIEELEDMRENILDHIDALVAEATPVFCHYTLEKLVLIFGNIIKNPLEDKFKTLKMENQVFYSNIGRFLSGIKFLKFLGFETTRLDNNKLAYRYEGRVGKDGDLHPLMQMAWDELKQELAKLKQNMNDSGTGFSLSEIASASDDQDRISCAFCLRKFAKDRIDTHQFICNKLKQKPKRKVWDDRKKRLQGTPFENFQPKYGRNEFHKKFELCLSRRDQANMAKIIQGLKMSREEYMEKARELKQDHELYFRCRGCREIMHQTLTKGHKCEEEDQ
ncbi:hypothetical protein FGO68_gene13586 [Halteria grandinella]|uniref:C2HC/C3H-type domain-containing protein n=1 Tax=Halteria grandinella TaxID=5974 RepID=A0A8J8NTX0_HALGN|nr:hypothetical protein FGO68_gene13586 [Halteria grandinella]